MIYSDQEPEQIIEEFLSDFKYKLTLQGKKFQTENCEVCEEKIAKYTCPKCEINYCCIQCYQNHDSSCLKKFKRETIEVGKGQKMSEQSVKDFKRKLRNFQDDQNVDKMLLENEKQLRFQQLAEKLNENLTLDDLSSFELAEFLIWVKDYKIEKVWQPFWYKEEGKFSLFVEELNPEQTGYQTSKKNYLNNFNEDEDAMEEEENTYMVARYQYLKDFIDQIQNLSKLSKKSVPPPNPNIKYHLVNILYSTILLFRFYDGDAYNNKEEFLNNIGLISDCIKNQIIQIEDFPSAINQVHSKQNNINQILQNYYSIALEDLQHVLSDKFYILEIIYHLHQIIYLNPNKANKENLLKIKKIQYFSSFIKFQLEFQTLKDLRLQALRFSYDFQQQKQTMEKFKEVKKMNLLI